MDLLLTDKQDRLILADFKTGNSVDRKKGVPYSDVWVQESAYKVALESTYPGVKVAELLMLHVRHDVPADKVAYTCPDMARASEAWIRVRGLFDDLKVLEGAI